MALLRHGMGIPVIQYHDATLRKLKKPLYKTGWGLHHDFNFEPPEL
jgi:hypothetical protein